MYTREEAAAAAAGSLHLEGLQPDAELTAALQQWSDGQLSSSQLEQFAADAAAGKPRPTAADRAA